MRRWYSAPAVLEPYGPEVIDLTPGTPRFDLLPSVSARLPADRRGWPPLRGLPELQAAVAAKLLADNGLAVSPGEEVLITAGGLGAANIAIDAFVSRGEPVVLLDPTAPLYPLLLGARRARLRWLPDRLTPDTRFPDPPHFELRRLQRWRARI